MINCTNRNPVTNVADFIIDAAADVSDLPTQENEGANGEAPVAMGSDALCIATGDLYFLTGNGTWTAL